MNRLYMDTSRLLVNTQHLLQQMMTLPGSTQEMQLNESLDQLIQDVSRLKTLARKEVPSRRQEAHMKVEQLTSDLEALQRAHQAYQRRRGQVEKDTEQREELLTKRYTTNSSQHGGGAATSIAMDSTMSSQHHQNNLVEANTKLEDIISHGNSVMDNIRSQRLTLKGAQRKLLDLASTLGLSNTVMRLIERRTEQDKWIFWIGVAMTTIIILLLIYYFVL